MSSDYDGAWKEVSREKFRDALRCFFPEMELGVDWSPRPDFLEQELRSLTIQGWSADNRVDLLVRVATINGVERQIYLHLEVQGFKEDYFAARLFRCYHGLRSACSPEVDTLAFLADLDPVWKPDGYRHELFGCEVFFRFPCCKLIEILPRLKGDRSLPALAAQAQIEALATSRHPERRLAAGWRLTRRLYESGYSRNEVRDAFALLARMMRLPTAEAVTFRETLITYETENSMPYVTDIEDLAIEQGMEKGRGISLQESIREVLIARFGEVPDGLRSKINSLTEVAQLQAVLRTAARCADLETFGPSLFQVGKGEGNCILSLPDLKLRRDLKPRARRLASCMRPLMASMSPFVTRVCRKATTPFQCSRIV